MIKPQEHKFCPTPSEWRKAEERVLETNLNRFNDTIQFIDEANGLYQDFIQSLPDFIDETDNPQIIEKLMLCKAHKALLTGLHVLLRGGIPEYQAIIRNAVMFAADAVKIAEKPTLADIWMNRESYTKEYKEGFKPAFPRGHPITSRLFDSYNLFSEAGAHSGSTQLSQSIRESTDEHVFLYIHTERVETLRCLLHLLNLFPAILLGFTHGLKQYVKNDIEGETMSLVAKIQSHLERYRTDVMPPHLKPNRESENK